MTREYRVKVKPYPVELPEIGHVCIRGLTLRDRGRLLEVVSDGGTQYELACFILERMVVDENNECVLDAESWSHWGGENIKISEELTDHCLSRAGLGEDSDSKKNSK